jgi:hypothetical protein
LQEQELNESEKGSEVAFKELADVFKDRIFNTSLGFVQNAEDDEE